MYQPISLKTPKIALLFFTSILALLLAGQYENPKKKPQSLEVFVWPEGKKAALSLTFDDARISQVDAGMPIFEKYRVRATFFVSPNNLEQRLEAWKKALQDGHEIGNHTLTHPCTGNYAFSKENALEDYTLEKIAQEINGADEVISRLLGVKPDNFAYPCCQTFVGRGKDVRSYVPLVAERFLTGRLGLNEDANDPTHCDPAQLLALGSDGQSFDTLKQLIDQAVRDGRWLILCGHEIGEGGQQTTLAQALEKVCQYAKDPRNGLWIDTVGNIGRYIIDMRKIGSETPKTGKLPYPDSTQPQEKRIDDLLRRMTLEEKIGQMNMPCVYESALGDSIAEKMEACQKFAEGTHFKNFGPGGGFFTLPNTILHEGPRQQAEFLNELQLIAIKKTRLGVPLLLTEEGTHGLMCPGATIFPEGPGLGSTWNVDLVAQIFAAAAEEARSIGIHQIFTLVIEPIRDPRLGRNEEAYSEDPYLCARFAETIVKAVQGDDVSAVDKCVAGLCHYPGQSQPVSGLERGAMEISERMLREVFLPPWEAGISKAGGLGVMVTYPAIDGVPAHASEKILTSILRDEFGFQGLVLSEGGGIGTLVYEGLAPTQKEAGELAIKAGVDVGISYESGYMRDLMASVREGKVSMALVDRAVRRILRQKMRLGLFGNALVDPSRAEKIVHNPEHQDLALQAAREGIVLLKNEKGLLPLRKDLKSIAVLGPNADDERNQLGDYTAAKVLQDVTTILEGIRETVSPQTQVSFVKGCDVIGSGIDEIGRAKDAAAKADVAVVVVGESEWQAEGKSGTSGEGYDAATLELTGLQEELIKAVFETGTPTVAVLVNGRPLAVRYAAEHVPAILEAWVCGEQGGRAVAEILFGDYNPSGKLPVTFPRHAGQLPVYYNAKKSKQYWLKEGWGKPYADLDPTPLFPFGHGLSYTRYEYSNLRFNAEEIGPAGSIEISADIKNAGGRFGEEIVELYVQDVISSISTPVEELRGFAKIGLEPGQTKTVKFLLTPEHLSLYNQRLERVVEPGQFKVFIGSSSEDIRLSGDFTVR